ncbi:MAG TPA: addiction module protein [Candidatus Binatia bacterium]|jgi:putative addiction module component (TIGR02574 family)
MSDAAKSLELESEALRLPAEERARLAERLLASLESETDARAEALWLAEAERRLDELESGHVIGVNADQVLADARSKLR